MKKLIIACIFMIPLFANEIHPGNRVTIKTRPSSIHSTTKSEKSTETFASEDIPYQAGYSIDSRLLPHEYHLLNGKDSTNGMIELEDGSIWSLKDTHEEWEMNDNLALCPNTNFFFDKEYQFKIYNLYKGNFAYANISFGPFIDNPDTYIIVDIDQSNNSLCFGNQNVVFRCKTDPTDNKRLKQWIQDDTVIIGLEGPKNSSQWKHILFNCQTGTIIKARIIGE
ncbi:MAG: hypothetical protein JW769_04815 [Parachlamydiales bacterium]|nr:hypothetical protein [Parachlamydiales bacterium]